MWEPMTLREAESRGFFRIMLPDGVDLGLGAFLLTMIDVKLSQFDGHADPVDRLSFGCECFLVGALDSKGISRIVQLLKSIAQTFLGHRSGAPGTSSAAWRPSVLPIFCVETSPRMRLLQEQPVVMRACGEWPHRPRRIGAAHAKGR